MNSSPAKVSPTIRAILTPDKILFMLILALVGLLTGPVFCWAEPGPMQKLSGHSGPLARPVEEKISLGKPALLDWQLKINKDYGSNIRPNQASPDNPLIPKVRSMLSSLPLEVKRIAYRYLVALYLLENDFGTGTTEAVQDANGQWSLSYIALNLTALNRKANAWGSWKEQSAFRPEKGHEIRMTLENPGEDTQEAAIRFIFLHELGHVAGLALKAHGFWDAETLPPETEESPFVSISWRPDGKGKMFSPWKKKLKALSKLGFYKFEKAPQRISEAEGAYRALATTDFPSLYAATNLFDDFAEVFAIYVHTRLMKKPYRVEVYKNGERRFVYHSCITDGRCAEKVAVLEGLLKMK